MKKYVLIIAIIIGGMSFAQDNGFNYKALIMENDSPLSFHSIGLQFSIFRDNVFIYKETHTTTTDANGLVSVQIGEGNVVSGNFSTIDWGADPYFLKTEIDTGNGFVNFGTKELKMVPFAKFADKAGNVFSGDYNDLINVPSAFIAVPANVPASNVGEAIYHLGNLSIGTTGSINNASFSVNNAYTGNDAEYGIYTRISGIGSGPRIAYYSSIYGSHQGDEKSFITQNQSNGDGTHVGISNSLYGSGNGIHYGSYNNMLGTGTGKKYGSYNYISPSAGGEHYAVYGNALKNTPNVYAGYFKGKVHITNGKLTAPDSGEADMKAYIYGFVSTNGSLGGASTDGFTVTNTAAGEYKISFTQSMTGSNYIVIATLTNGYYGFVYVIKSNSYFKINTRSAAGSLTNMAFNFVVYKK